MKKQDKTNAPETTAAAAAVTITEDAPIVSGNSDAAPAEKSNPRLVGQLLLIPGILLFVLGAWMFLSTRGTRLLTVASSTGEFLRQYPLFLCVGGVCLLLALLLIKTHPKAKPDAKKAAETTEGAKPDGEKPDGEKPETVKTAEAASAVPTPADTASAPTPTPVSEDNADTKAAAEAAAEKSEAPETTEVPETKEAPQKRFCMNCGAQLSETDKFCLACGTKVE